MSKLVIVAEITAKANHVDTVKKELKKMIAETLKEEGCIQYDLHQDTENQAFFLFYEIWETRDLWQAHMQQPHLAAFKVIADEAVENVVIREMNLVE